MSNAVTSKIEEKNGPLSDLRSFLYGGLGSGSELKGLGQGTASIVEEGVGSSSSICNSGGGKGKPSTSISTSAATDASIEKFDESMKMGNSAIERAQEVIDMAKAGTL